VIVTLQEDMARMIIGDLRLSPDGRRFATAESRRLRTIQGDKIIKVWDARTGRELRTLRGHAAEVTQVCFSPDGTRLASVGDNGAVKLWDASTGEELFALRGHTDRVWSVCFSPDGQLLATGGFDRTVKLWDARTGQQETTARTEIGAVSRVCFSPDGQHLAWAVSDSMGGEVSLWDVRTERKLRTLWRHAATAHGVFFSPDGQRVAFRCGAMTLGGFRQFPHQKPAEAHTIRVCEVATGREVLTLDGRAHRSARLCFSGDGQRLVVVSRDSPLKVWDARSGQELSPLELKLTVRDCFSVRHDGRAVKVGDLRTGQVLTLQGHADEIWDVCLSADGKRLASASKDRTVKVWYTQTGKELLTLQTGKELLTPLGITPPPWSVCFSPDGLRLAVGHEDGSVQLWDAATGQELLTLRGHRMHIKSLCFSPDSRRLASACLEGIVKVWDARPGPSELVLRGHKEDVRSVGFSPDGQRLVSRDIGRELVWDLRSGALLPDAKVQDAVPGPRSPDGKRYANAEMNVIRVIDLTARQPLSEEHPWLAPDPAWHEEQAGGAEREGRWFAAAFHHGRLLREVDPWNADRHLRCGHALAQLGQRAKAALHFAQVVLLRQRVDRRPPRGAVVPATPWAPVDVGDQK
jgi:WD40 repeat protein